MNDWIKSGRLFNNCSYVKYNNSKSRIVELVTGKEYYSRYTCKCRTHESCAAQVSIFNNCTRFLFIHFQVKVEYLRGEWILSSRGLHNSASFVKLKRSIHAPVRARVDELIVEGYSATAILTNLKKEGTPLELQPSVRQLNSRKSTVKQQNLLDYGFTTNDDIKQFAMKNLVTTREQFEALGIICDLDVFTFNGTLVGVNDLIVLDVFETEIQDPITAITFNSCGFAYSSKSECNQLFLSVYNSVIYCSHLAECCSASGGSYASRENMHIKKYGCNLQPRCKRVGSLQLWLR